MSLLMMTIASSGGVIEPSGGGVLTVNYEALKINGADLVII